ncbi:MAG: hypothetical protein SGILL_008623 [Bacillariaceae sp.]
MVVALNMSYLPTIVSVDNNSSPVLEAPKKAKLVNMEKIREFSEKRRASRKKVPLEILRKTPTADATAGAAADNKAKTTSGTDTAAAAAAKPAAAADPPPQPASSSSSTIAGLNCDRFGGPSEEIAAEMVYWRDIPNDAIFHSPFANYGPKTKYLVFEPDEGGWNNIRMSMETATALAHAMGRILVLPPEQNMYLLNKDSGSNNRFTFRKFFPFDAISEEHSAVEVISMEEFLDREVMTGKLKDANGTAAFPPSNRTNWEGHIRDGKDFWHWLRNVTHPPIWDFSRCTSAFAKEPGQEGAERLKKIMASLDIEHHPPVVQDYINKPTPVDAPPAQRLKEMLAHRKSLCIYDDYLQNQKVMHFMGDNDSGARLLVHFYAFMFFEDFKSDLWTKRYVRDHLRYIDDIQCAAAKIVDAVRQKARENGDPNGSFDTMHIRRGDFQYKQTQIDADEIVENIKDFMAENRTLFIATDEKDLNFFKPFTERYKVLFLNDFLHLVPDLNKNYYGMLDQRIASRGETFAGAMFSTFTGYINRMRGYHTQKEKLPGWKDGTMKSYYYVEKQHKDELINYYPIKGPLWGREFPTSWRDIDHDVHPDHMIG